MERENGEVDAIEWMRLNDICEHSISLDVIIFEHFKAC